MEITNKMLELSRVLAYEQNLFSKLNLLYNEIPGGKCAGCAKCCMESVNAFYIEFLNILDYVKANGLYDDIMNRVEDHYFNELITVKPCPFLDENKRCMIYEVRPHVCRLFGHSTKEEHEENYQQVLLQNKEASAYFYENYGVHLSREVVFHKIDYCENFLVNKKMLFEEKMQLIDQLFMIDTQFLMEDILNEDMLNMSITNWFIYLHYCEDDASMKRIDRLLNISRNHDYI